MTPRGGGFYPVPGKIPVCNGVEIMLAEEFMRQAVGSDLHMVF